MNYTTTLRAEQGAEAPWVEAFDGLAEYYDAYRPGYPPEAFDLLFAGGALPERLIADVWAGTGKSTAPLLAGAEASRLCIAVEPSCDMRRVLSRNFAGNPRPQTIRAAVSGGTASGMRCRDIVPQTADAGEERAGKQGGTDRLEFAGLRRCLSAFRARRPEPIREQRSPRRQRAVWHNSRETRTDIHRATHAIKQAGLIWIRYSSAMRAAAPGSLHQRPDACQCPMTREIPFAQG